MAYDPQPCIGTNLTLKQVVISNGQTTSADVKIDGAMIAGIDCGATLTGTAITLTHTVDGTNYRPVTDSSGNAVSWTVASNKFVKFDPPLVGYYHIQLVSGSSEGADRTLTLVLVP